MKTKILLITRNLPPLVGGMEKLNFNMINELSRHSDIHIIGPKQDTESPIKFKCKSFQGIKINPAWLFLLKSLLMALKTARKNKFDFIIAGSGLIAPIAWVSAKLGKTKSIAYIHGLDVDVDSKMYQAFWVSAILNLDLIIANSEATLDLALGRGLKKNKSRIIYPGVSLPDKNKKQLSIQTFCDKYDIRPGEFILSVGRLTTRKGLLEFVENSLLNIINSHPCISLVVIGDEPKDSLLALPQSKQSILEAADKLGIGNKLKFLGVITDSTLLSGAYWAAAAHVFPVKNIPNDPEGFGMVAIEAAAHGLPTIAFATGGTISSVLEGESGFLVQPSDYQHFSDQVVCAIHAKDTMSPKCIQFSLKFSWKNFGESLKDALNDIKQKKSQP